ncbi:MAG: hypothetical protein ABIA74_03440 [bacterium]
MKFFNYILILVLSFLCLKNSFSGVIENQTSTANFSIAAPWSKSSDYTSYHESGHFLFASLLNNKRIESEIVEEFSFFVFSDFTGSTSTYFPNDFSITLEQELDRICFYLAGGIATEIIYGSKNGVSDDEAQVEKHIKNLLEKYKNDSVPLNKIKDYFGLSIFTKEDFNFKCLKGECYKKTEKIISENIELLKLIANKLEDKRKLDYEEMEKLICDFESIEI